MLSGTQKAIGMLIAGALVIAGATVAILSARTEAGLMPPSSYVGASSCDEVIADRYDFPILIEYGEMPRDVVSDAAEFWNRTLRRDVFVVSAQDKRAELLEEEKPVIVLGQNNRGPRPAQISIEGVPSPWLERSNTLTKDEPTHARAHLRLFGCRIKFAGVLAPNDLQSRNAMVRVLAHEFGHYLGLDHDPWESSVMYPKASALFPWGVSEHDLKLLREVYDADSLR